MIEQLAMHQEVSIRKYLDIVIDDSNTIRYERTVYSVPNYRNMQQYIWWTNYF